MTLLAAHLGTGCDTLSRVGTQLGALNSIPEMYLEGLGKGDLNERQLKKCEQYLVKVSKLNTECKTFDSLREFQHRNNEPIFDLAPTSFLIININGHILRWFFLFKELSNILNHDYNPLDPCDYQ